MSEAGEVWKAMKEESAERRNRHRSNAPTILQGAGISYESKNDGAHLVVAAEAIFDFWPGTGLWICRKNGKRGRGIRSLIAAAKGEK